MTETKKIIRRMRYVIIWTLFVGLTLSGLIYAYEQTRFVADGTEASTIRIDEIYSTD